MPPDVDHALAVTIREEGGWIVASLARILGDLELAEDAVQDAAVRALDSWPRNGVPDSPRAWLMVTARRAAIDRVRRENQRSGKERAGADHAGEFLAEDDGLSELVPDSALRDDRLRLIFTCCHPALALDAQLALALRVLCGLDIPQLASVLQCSEAAVSKRLTRTRSKIKNAHLPYRVPRRRGADRATHRRLCRDRGGLHRRAHPAAGDGAGRRRRSCGSRPVGPLGARPPAR